MSKGERTRKQATAGLGPLRARTVRLQHGKSDAAAGHKPFGCSREAAAPRARGPRATKPGSEQRRGSGAGAPGERGAGQQGLQLPRLPTRNPHRHAARRGGPTGLPRPSPPLARTMLVTEGKKAPRALKQFKKRLLAPRFGRPTRRRRRSAPGRHQALPFRFLGQCRTRTTMRQAS